MDHELCNALYRKHHRSRRINEKLHEYFMFPFNAILTKNTILNFFWKRKGELPHAQIESLNITDVLSEQKTKQNST